MPKTELKSHYRTCNLCEAMCGLKKEFSGTKIHSIKGNKQDPFSQGHICPKAVALQNLYTDKDRLKKPVKRTADGWLEISWKQAFDEIKKNIHAIQSKHGDDAVGTYIGNPMVHNLEGMLFGPDFFRQLRTGKKFARYHSRISQYPETIGEFPVVALAEEIMTPGKGQIKAMVTASGNPLLSNPNNQLLKKAFGSLEFMFSIDLAPQELVEDLARLSEKFVDQLTGNAALNGVPIKLSTV